MLAWLRRFWGAQPCMCINVFPRSFTILSVSQTDAVGIAGEVLITYSNWLWLLAAFQQKSGYNAPVVLRVGVLLTCWSPPTWWRYIYAQCYDQITYKENNYYFNRSAEHDSLLRPRFHVNFSVITDIRRQNPEENLFRISSDMWPDRFAELKDHQCTFGLRANTHLGKPQIQDSCFEVVF